MTASGISAQLMIAAETTRGTFVTPTRGYEFLDESMALNTERIESKGLRAGTRVLRSDRWREGKRSAAGSINMEVGNKSFGLWFEHMMGSAAISTPGGATNTRLHTFTPGDLPTGLTAQVGKPDLGAVVRPFSYIGAKVDKWKLAAKLDGFLELGVTLDAQDETTAQSLAAASYPANLDLLTFVHGALTMGGSALNVRSFDLDGDNGLTTGRHRFGSQLSEAPIEGDMREYTGTLDAFYDDLTSYNRFVNGTEAALVMTFTAPELVETGFNYFARITANIRTDGDTPQVSGPDEIPQNVSFKCLDTGSGPATALTIEYQNADTAP